MPEGHTIHRLAREHRGLFGGAVVTAQSPQGRFEVGAAAISGRVLQRVEPYGKHLLYRFEGLPERLHVHLGLYGKFIPERCRRPSRAGRCGFVSPAARATPICAVRPRASCCFPVR